MVAMESVNKTINGTGNVGVGNSKAKVDKVSNSTSVIADCITACGDYIELADKVMRRCKKIRLSH